jgi:CPA2 family monovalent cation:H+ antiporter-2
MPEHFSGLPYLRETLIFLALAGILIPLLQRLRINQILGFLAIGVLLGPFGLWLWVGHLPWLENLTFIRVEGMVALGELGVLFLMFTIGLELSAERLWMLRRWVFGAGTAQVLLSALLIGTVALMLHNDPPTAIVLGLMLALSSTAVVMQLMTDRHMLDTPMAQANFSVLMLQDLAVVPILVLTGGLAQGNTEHLWLTLIAVALKSAGVILLIYFLGRRVIRPLFKALGNQYRHQHQPATFVALILLCTLGTAGLTAYAGLSMALGAFLAGLLLAETEFRHEVEVTIEPFKSLLLGLFFMSVGMQTDVRVVLASPLLLALCVAGLFILKAAVMMLVLRIGGLPLGRAFEGGMLMGQGGEFAFIVTSYALASGLFTNALSQFVLLLVGLSMFATPLMARLGRVLGNAWETSHHCAPAALNKAETGALAGHVIIVGFGRMGQLLAEILNAQGVRYVAIDIDMYQSTRKHPLGEPVYFGDVSRPELLHRVHASKSAAIVLTMDHAEATLHATRAIRREFADIPLLARAHDEDHAVALREAGATQVMPETLAAGLQLSSAVLQMMGMSKTQVNNAIRLERHIRLARVRESKDGFFGAPCDDASDK